MSALKLWPFQTEAVEALHKAHDGPHSRVGVVLPTGSGKTVVFSEYAKQWRAGVREGAPSRVLILAHRDELVRQAVNKLRSAAPTLSVGVVKAERDQVRHPVVVASVQTLRSAVRMKRVRDVGLVVVDECHHASADSYLKILEHYGCFTDDGAFAVGFTATMARGDDKALGDVWQDVVYQRSIREMIRDGYLVKPVGKRVYVEDLDMTKVRVRGGDFREGDLGAALEQSLAPETIAAAYAEHAGTRQGIIFAPTVATAHLLGDTMREAGYTCATVTGETPPGERRAALVDFMAGRIQILSNCMVLTEGTDLPPASCAVIARPTKNAALYIQMVGRVLRRWPGKDDALVLDVVGVSTRHALTSPVELWGDERRKDAAEDDGEVSEAPERSEAVSLDELDDYAVGEVRSVEVDLFHGSASMWLQTRRGVRFIPAGERLIALLGSQQSGCWDVVEIQTKVRGSDWVVQGVSDLSYAMAYAEGAVTPQEMTLAHRSRGWRVKVPTDRQRDQAERMGIHIAAGASSGDVSNQIATVMGSRRIDPYLQPWMVK